MHFSCAILVTIIRRRCDYLSRYRVLSGAYPVVQEDRQVERPFGGACLTEETSFSLRRVASPPPASRTAASAAAAAAAAASTSCAADFSWLKSFFGGLNGKTDRVLGVPGLIFHRNLHTSDFHCLSTAFLHWMPQVRG